MRPSCRRSAFVGWITAAALCQAAAGCGAATARQARTLAETQLACTGRALAVKPIGELVVRPRAPVTLHLYDAEGCGAARAYLCLVGDSGRCVTDTAELPADLAPLAARALHLRRTVSRARCPASAERVVQESESLWRFEACDGTWALHCPLVGPDTPAQATCEPLGWRVTDALQNLPPPPQREVPADASARKTSAK